jgi:shikimate kinase
MGVGKSTTAQQLAHDLGLNFVDLDATVEKINKSSINELTERFGLSTLRKLEAEALRGTSESKNQVIALGAGTLMNPESEEIVRHSGISIYLEAPEETLLQRIVSDQSKKRPLIGLLIEDHRNDLNNQEAKAKAVERIRELLEQRIPTYKKADFEIETENKEIRVVCQEIEALINKDVAKASA